MMATCAQIPVLTLGLIRRLDPGSLGTDVVLPLPSEGQAGTQTAANAIVFSVDLDLLGDGRYIVPGAVDALASRQGVAFFQAPQQASAVLHAHTRLLEDGELSVSIAWH